MSGDNQNDFEEDIEELLETEVSDEYETDFEDSTERAADFGSLMVSIRLVANQLNQWTEKGRIPEVYQLEKKQKMIQDALNESPTENLDPESNELDRKASEVVAYAERLLDSLEELESVRETVNNVNKELNHYKAENFDLMDSH